MSSLKRIIKKILPVSKLKFPYRDFNDKYKVVFVHIPKNAGTSIIKTLEPDVRVYQTHVSSKVFKSSDAIRYERYHSFAIARNPYDRLVSAYHYLCNGGDGKSDNKLSERVSSFRNFREFVYSITIEDLYGITVLNPQWLYVYSMENNEIDVDSIFKIEEIDELNNFLLKLDANLVMSKENRGSHLVWHEYYDDELRFKVYDMYRLDFEILGYER